MFFRRFSNPFENRHYRAPRINDLLPSTKDQIFQWQLDATDFTRLDEDTILRAGICPSKTHAIKILKACHKLGIIDPGSGRPDTTRIDRNMVAGMPSSVCVQKQRELVMLLFFWEEEVMRWRLLGVEEGEIQGKVARGEQEEGVLRELREALSMVRARKRVLPSLRDQSGRVIDRERERLPSYAEARAMRHGSV